MATRKTRLARVTGTSTGGTPKKETARGRQLVSQDEIWHRFRLFCVENRVNISEGFETVVMVLDKYKGAPEKIGPKIFKALALRNSLTGDERLTMDDI